MVNFQGLDFILLGAMDRQLFLLDEELADGRMTPFDDARQRHREELDNTSTDEDETEDVEGNSLNRLLGHSVEDIDDNRCCDVLCFYSGPFYGGIKINMIHVLCILRHSFGTKA